MQQIAIYTATSLCDLKEYKNGIYPCIVKYMTRVNIKHTLYTLSPSYYTLTANLQYQQLKGSYELYIKYFSDDFTCSNYYTAKICPH